MKVDTTACVLAILFFPLTLGQNNPCPEIKDPIQCSETEMVCYGGIDAIGCKQPDYCIPAKINGNCSNFCSTDCGLGMMKCPGPKDLSSDCPMPDFCFPTDQDFTGKDCPNPQCPVSCGPDELFCARGTDKSGCKIPDVCVPSKSGMTGLDGSECLAFCPVACGEDQMVCSGGEDQNGCPRPDICIPNKGPVKSDGSFCPAVCPKECGSNELTCGGVSPEGCPIENTCLPIDINGECPPICPTTCSNGFQTCAGGKDHRGCAMPDFCTPTNGPIKDDGSVCPGLCPVHCNSAEQMQCYGGIGNDGCPTADFCVDRNASGQCPPFCPTNCGPNSLTCPGPKTPNGCPSPDFCLPLSNVQGLDGNDCPALGCPAQCGPLEMPCSKGTDQNGCYLGDYCIARTTPGPDGKECPAHCPANCPPEMVLCAPDPNTECPMPSQCAPSVEDCPKF